VEEAAAMDTLVSDKTGTLTQNSLTYAGAAPLAADADENAVLRAAALASDDATQDPLDLAILAAARQRGLLADAPPRQDFRPFDPATRRSEGVYAVDEHEWQAVKGAANVIGRLCVLDAAQQPRSVPPSENSPKAARVCWRWPPAHSTRCTCSVQLVCLIRRGPMPQLWSPSLNSWAYVYEWPLATRWRPRAPLAPNLA
jgi:hypothetical protein